MKVIDNKFFRSENYRNIQLDSDVAILTGNDLLDAWWSFKGGIIAGTSIFLTGTSGAGKTTLSVFLAKILENYKTLIYSREMPRSAVKQQTERLNLNHDNLFLADLDTCSHFNEFLKELEETKPKFVVIDSLQVVAREDFADMNEENAQYHIIQVLRQWIKDNNAVLFIIGHNKKDGEFRGANTIMQMFDAHLEMVHDKKSDIRTMSWGHKNRKGPIGTLYYKFTSNSIIFFKEIEEQTLEEKMQLILDNLTSKCKKEKEHHNYELFKENVDKACKNKTYEMEIERICFLISILQKNYEKFLKK